MNRRGLIIAAAIALPLLYLAAWPVPIEPVSWQAPEDRGLVDPFTPNDIIAHAQFISISPDYGPEDITAGPDGRVYTGTAEGRILRVDTFRGVEGFAVTGGRPLGLEFDADGNLWVANATLGLQRIDREGNVEIVADTVDGDKIRYADDLAVAIDGSVYFSDASTKHGAEIGSYQASLVDILEHGGHGRVLRYDPGSGDVSTVMDGLDFANGVAISDDNSYLLIAETGSYRVLRHWLTGRRGGETEVVIDNLPGFPDNINSGRSGKFWVGLVAPRSSLLDKLSNKPFLRKVVQRLPSLMRPQAEPSSHAFAMTGDGEVLINLYDTRAAFPAVTGVYETHDALWLSSLFARGMVKLPKAMLTQP